MKSIQSICNSLLQKSQHYRHCQQWNKARAVLNMALRFRLSTAQSVLIQTHLAELEMELGHFAQARRHLQIAMTQKPKDARPHYLMGTSYELDENKSAEQALPYYRQAVKLANDQPQYSLALGRTYLILGKAPLALRQWLSGAAIDLNDLACLEAYFELLVQLANPTKVRQQLQRLSFGRYRNPAFQKLRRKVEFHLASQAQVQHQELRIYLADEEPALLPFPERPRVTTSPTAEGMILRMDGPSQSKPHIPRKSRARFETQS